MILMSKQERINIQYFCDLCNGEIDYDSFNLIRGGFKQGSSCDGPIIDKDLCEGCLTFIYNYCKGNRVFEDG